MRIRIIFELLNRGAALPFHHQYLIDGLLSPYINEYLTSVSAPYKVFYNFSSLKGQTKINKDGIGFYSARVSIVFSSNDPDLIRFMAVTVFRKNNLKLGNLILNSISIEKEKAVSFKKEMKYLCLSPLSLLGTEENTIGATVFINPAFDEFSDALFESTLNKMEQAGVYPDENEHISAFQMVPDDDYLQKIKGEERQFSRIYPVYLNERKYELRGYTFPFTLYADPQIHAFIFDCGFGECTNKGFGMLDLANTDPAFRTEPYF